MMETLVDDDEVVSTWSVHIPNMITTTLQLEINKEIYDQEVKENKIMVIWYVSIHAMGCWQDGADHDYW